MAVIREKYWIPTLRRLVKSVRSACWYKHGISILVSAWYKRFCALPVRAPPPSGAFEVNGTDCPILYKLRNKKEGKAYMIIFSCSLSRAVHLEPVTNLETTTFLPCVRRLLARRGNPSMIYSDNESTFVKAAKWLTQVIRDEQYNGFLESKDIKWKFNLSRPPWWGAGGRFEPLIDIVKATMYRVIGRATFSWDELSEVLLDADSQVNRRPLSYVEGDFELPILTPASFLFQLPPASLAPSLADQGQGFEEKIQIFEVQKGSVMEQVATGTLNFLARASQSCPLSSQVSSRSWRCRNCTV